MFFILSISLLAYLSYLFVFVVCLLCAQLCWQTLMADYSSQWKLVMELDEYIRGATFTVNDRIVWNIDHDDDYVSRFRYDIRMKHLDAASRFSGSSHRDAPASHQRRGGTSDSSVI